MKSSALPHELTFEWDESKEQLEIHGDKQGLNCLILAIESLVANEAPDNMHLMTEDWGGSHLSSDKQNQMAKLINHVKILKW